MTISKRLRYEVLRRDGHTCRYCGASAPTVELTVDHVVPLALGGNDEPSNLVTACWPCNSGKTSTSPDGPLVADVAQDALRWAAAMKRSAMVQQADRESAREFADAFVQMWGASSSVALPGNWESSLERLHASGLELGDLFYAVENALLSPVPSSRLWRYFYGICNRLIAERQDIARSLIEADEREVGGLDDAY